MEMRAGARLIVVVPGGLEEGPGGPMLLMKAVMEGLEETVRDGVLSKSELAGMLIPAYPRSPEQLRAPFADGAFAGLVLEEELAFQPPDVVWEQYERDQNAGALADGYIRFFQATFQPSLLRCLDAARSPAERHAFVTAFEAVLRRAISTRPTRLGHRLNGIVAARI
jgi:hypothetical protein